MLSENNKKIIMDSGAIDRSLTRIAHEIIERNPDSAELCLIGIQRKGVPLAKQIAASISSFSDVKVNVGELDITLHRDDLPPEHEHTVIHGTTINFPIHNKVVILVDDVIYTGRTVRAAIEALMDAGRPDCIQLIVMVDRGHRELPIRADFIGKNIPTSLNEIVHVCVPEFDGENAVYISTTEPVRR